MPTTGIGRSLRSLVSGDAADRTLASTMGSIRPPDPPIDPRDVGDVPREVADAIDTLARYRLAVARVGSAASATKDARLRIASDREARRLDGEARAERLAEARETLEACRLEREAHGALRAAVERYARALRRDGVPPERMIVAVKSVVRRAARAPAPLPDPEHLIPDLVQWSVAAYFAAD